MHRRKKSKYYRVLKVIAILDIIGVVIITCLVQYAKGRHYF
jgi:hypothetical protein